jgi:hypothetical protein
VLAFVFVFVCPLCLSLLSLSELNSKHPPQLHSLHTDFGTRPWNLTMAEPPKKLQQACVDCGVMSANFGIDDENGVWSGRKWCAEVCVVVM